jgi:hypothetical protein
MIIIIQYNTAQYNTIQLNLYLSPKEEIHNMQVRLKIIQKSKFMYNTHNGFHTRIHAAHGQIGKRGQCKRPTFFPPFLP